MKHLANEITCLRVIAAFLLIFATPLHIDFYILYSICGITDMIDGTVARKTHTASKTGAILDSIADMIFLVVAAIKLAPSLYLLLPVWTYGTIIGIALVKIVAYGVGAFRFHSLVALHTVLNKIVGVFLFLIPYFFIGHHIQQLLIGICVIAGVAAIEELLCQCFMKSCDRDIKTIFELIKMDHT